MRFSRCLYRSTGKFHLKRDIFHRRSLWAPFTDIAVTGEALLSAGSRFGCRPTAWTASGGCKEQHGREENKGPQEWSENRLPGEYGRVVEEHGARGRNAGLGGWSKILGSDRAWTGWPGGGRENASPPRRTPEKKGSRCRLRLRSISRGWGGAGAGRPARPGELARSCHSRYDQPRSQYHR